jgi:outer membrane receptor protein involved in Fe transport
MPRNGSLFRVAGFYRTLRNFIVDLQDPQWAPGQAGAVVAAGSLQGAQVECEHWLTREISARAWLRFTDSKNGAGPGLDIPLQPRLTSQVAADFLSHSGLRGELSWVHVGSRYADLPNATRLGSYDVLNLRAAHQFNLHLDVFVVIDNVLGNRYEFWPDYPARGRTIQAGAEYRF